MKRTAVCITALAFAAAAHAQIGQLDQVSPLTAAGGANASFNLDADFLQWQQQITCGLSGQLEGVRVNMIQGAPGATFNIRIRTGPTWNLNPVLFETLVTKQVDGEEMIFVDMTGSNINLASGDVFVLETQGTGTGVWMYGTYRAPDQGPPFYPDPLFLLASPLGDGGWRHGFETYMLTGGGGCVGDTDGDLDVDLQDLATLLGSFGTSSGAGTDDGDTDGDGDVDLQDLATLLGAFGSTC
ncbi:MAG: hypothetical protein IT450_11860 [Phycisphaerales bacterium]|nr:hypothetical protein [Phycisphaerales bacterium]